MIQNPEQPKHGLAPSPAIPEHMMTLLRAMATMLESAGMPPEAGTMPVQLPPWATPPLACAYGSIRSAMTYVSDHMDLVRQQAPAAPPEATKEEP